MTQSEPTIGFFDEKPFEFPPIFGTGGNVAATLDDVRYCYLLVLGRYPESASVAEEASQQPVHALIRGMLKSPEFSRLLLTYASDRAVPHTQLGAAPSDDLLFWVNKRLIFDKAFHRAILAASSWADLIDALISRSDIVSIVGFDDSVKAALRESVRQSQQSAAARVDAEVISDAITGKAVIVCLLEECTTARVRGWVSSRKAPDGPTTLRVMIDGKFYCETDCNLPRSDLSSSGVPVLTGFKFQLPRHVVDGEEHTLEFFTENEQVTLIHQGKPYLVHHFNLAGASPIYSNVDGYDRGIIRGWALRADRDGRDLQGSVTVDVICNGERVARLKADRFRPDVAQLMGCDPHCGFIFDPPPFFKRSTAMLFHFVVVPENVELTNSPCSTSFGRDHREGKLLALQDVLERVSSEVDRLKLDIRALIARRHDDLSSYDRWFRSYLPALRASVAAARQARGAHRQSIVSLVCVLTWQDVDKFGATVASVLAQTYGAWELIIVADSSTRAVDEYLDQLAVSDGRIRRLRAGPLDANNGIDRAMNASRGEWIAFLEPYELLVDVALEVMVAGMEQSGAQVVYCDEDKVDSKGYFYDPLLKPDWNYRLLLSSNYIGNFVLIKSFLVRAIGALKSWSGHPSYYDLVLRLSEAVAKDDIVHISEILCHKSISPGRGAGSLLVERGLRDAGVDALSGHLTRKSLPARVSSMLDDTLYRIEWGFVAEPSVCVIIPIRDQAEITRRCLESLLSVTTYKNVRVVLVDNWSTQKEMTAVLDEVRSDPRVEIFRAEQEFNYSKLNNDAVAASQSEFLFFMNNDLIVSDSAWLNKVVNEALADETVGIVGGKFLFPNGTVQHAGVVLGLWGVAGHVNAGIPGDAPGYASRAVLTQELSAVTAAGMLVRRSVFQLIGGFEEVHLRVAFNDIDLCLKARRAGFKVIWTPAFVAEHHESLSRGHDIQPFRKQRFEAEMTYMKENWGDALKADPHYSRFFDRLGEPFCDLIDIT